ncbi:hypothetical protein [Sphingobacterium griseoflavum]|uniref:Uncharacterized protein n=1 Tax=Sphingobacterium griseoflavum TaxID=1474952 RepID=A0ABQ3HR75_9SPHI|nr:hypothetical protein GCM10017764_07530 [Sphingobacterium griseoflavum]
MFPIQLIAYNHPKADSPIDIDNQGIRIAPTFTELMFGNGNGAGVVAIHVGYPKACCMFFLLFQQLGDLAGDIRNAFSRMGT